jgi:hypothetical protein
MSGRAWRFGGLVVLALASACQSVIDAPFDQAELRPRPVHCELKKPLPPPGVEAAPGDIEITLVVSENDLGEGLAGDGTPAYLHLGFDVDDTCTGPGVAPRCVTPAWTGADAVDGPGGIDNGVSRMLFRQIELFSAPLLTSPQVNDRIRNGSIAPTAALRIRNYNGVFSDEQVDVELFVVHAPKDIPGMTARFDGSDVWPLVAEWVASGDAGGAVAKVYDPEAYVTGSQLVARLRGGALTFLNAPIEFLSATVTGTLAVDPGSQKWRLTNGVFAGVTRSEEILRAIPHGAKATLGVTTCTDSMGYATVKKLLCSGADAVDQTGSGTTRPCNLTTFGIGFQTMPVTFGAMLPAATPDRICPPETDPGNDNCAVPDPP